MTLQTGVLTGAWTAQNGACARNFFQGQKRRVSPQSQRFRQSFDFPTPFGCQPTVFFSFNEFFLPLEDGVTSFVFVETVSIGSSSAVAQLCLPRSQNLTGLSVAWTALAACKIPNTTTEVLTFATKQLSLTKETDDKQSISKQIQFPAFSSPPIITAVIQGIWAIGNASSPLSFEVVATATSPSSAGVSLVTTQQIGVDLVLLFSTTTEIQPTTITASPSAPISGSFAAPFEEPPRVLYGFSGFQLDDFAPVSFAINFTDLSLSRYTIGIAQTDLSRISVSAIVMHKSEVFDILDKSAEPTPSPSKSVGRDAVVGVSVAAVIAVAVVLAVVFRTRRRLLTVTRQFQAFKQKHSRSPSFLRRMSSSISMPNSISMALLGSRSDSISSPPPNRQRQRESIETYKDHLSSTGINVLMVPDVRGMFPIHYAVSRGDEFVFSYIVKNAGVPAAQAVNVKDSSGTTPLHLAAQYGHHALFQTLLKHGADPTAVTQTGRTVLHSACLCANQTHTLAALLEERADVNVVETSSGLSAAHLLLASSSTSPAALDLMIDSGHSACFDIPDPDGRTSLMSGIMLGNPLVMHMLHCVYAGRLRIDVALADHQGMTAMHHACAVGSLEVVQALIKLDGALIRHTSLMGYTPLMIACREGRVYVVRELLLRGCELLSVSHDGHTAASLAKASIADKNERAMVLMMLRNALLTRFPHAKDIPPQEPRSARTPDSPVGSDAAESQ
eukprot:TRINITY_DN3243_c0_g1_i2.p1 TRINITY_DN3243_c0_g1~~TRINITY_DN3243_c0_g1_i2.p1  ORF type:complete len:764 (-),score=141.17 TRINITY_DN3243_c0_g1_i2:91-2277(-)